MDLNVHLEEKMNDFPDDLKELAGLILKAIESGKTDTKIIEMLKEEIREKVIEEENR